MLRRRSLWVGLGCFALPAGLFLLLCSAMGFAPFGSSSILIFDLSDQFVEFLCALKGGDVFFSWGTALGGSYVGTFSYYVSSPFSLLTLLCPNEHMPVAVVFLVALKLGCAGLTFSWLLRHRTGRCDATTLAFSLCYALMSYSIVYAMSFMWLDGLIWLPVLLLGAEHIARDKTPLWLIPALALSFISSWYISYMLGLFVALYLLWLCVCDGKSLVGCLTAFGRLLLCALPALLLSAWLWLPTAMSMLTGKLADGSAPMVWGFNWTPDTLLYKLLVPGAYDSVTYTGSAWLYCSLAGTVLAGVWFFQKRPLRTKLSTGTFLALLALCLWFAPLDRVWHLFQAPNSFPGRWSFVVSCLILVLGYDALHRLLCQHTMPRFVTVLLALVMAVDMTANGLLLLHKLDLELGFEPYASYHDYKLQMQPLVDEVNREDTFARVASDVQRSRNEPAAFGYKGLTYFSSSYDGNVNRLLAGMGFAQDWFWTTSLGSTPVTDVVLGVGWRISGTPQPNWYTPVATSGNLILYRAAAPAAPGYFTAVDLTKPNAVPGSTSPDYHSGLLGALTGDYTPMYTQLEEHRTDEDMATTWTLTTQGGPLYAMFSRPEGYTGLLYVNGAFTGPVYTNETDCTLYLGTFDAGEAVEVTLITAAPASLRLGRFYELDSAALTQAVDTLAPNALQVTQLDNGLLEGILTAPTDGWVYTSIPAQPGWTVRVDGVETEYIALENALVSFPVTAGEHTVTLTYRAPGLTAGLWLTAAGTLWFAILLLRRKKTTP